MGKEIYALAFELLTALSAAGQPQTDGRSDLGIMADFFAADGQSAITDLDGQWAVLAEAGRRRHGRLDHRGFALSGADACLRLFRERPDALQSVPTGNIEIDQGSSSAHSG